MLEQNWTSLDGTSIYATIWNPDNSPKAVLAFVHGHGTHSRRYDDWFRDLVRDNIAVVSSDLRGHGRSGGKQGTIHRYAEYLQDVDLLMRKTKENFASLPVILYGHSMGATIVLSYLGTGSIRPDMAILASAWLELVQPPGKMKSLAIWLADSILPQVTISTGLRSGDFAPAPANAAPKERDPLMHKKISARCFREVQRASEKISAQGIPATLPLLFMHGSGDRVSAPGASQRLAGALPGNVTYREWKEAPHQLHAWEHSNIVTKFTIDWINNQL